jgi:anti-anti-sigma factor
MVKVGSATAGSCGFSSSLDDSSRGLVEMEILNGRERGKVTVVYEVLDVGGDQDLSNADALAERLSSAIRDGVHVIVDLNHAGFVDSSLVRGLLDAHAASVRVDDGGLLVVARPGTVARRLFDLVGLDRVVPVYDDRAAAIGSSR